ncbi:hypothetical protein P0Y35_14815 [Kiritimatiellaeota bacterium B1221]|nr:hypothetical protein [Kiritimatiellaeota bacterium B1221]
MKQIKSYLKPGTGHSSLLALSIDSHQISAARVIRERNGCRMTKSLTISIPGDSFSADPQPAGIALAAALREAGFKEKHCVVCLPPSWLLTASVPLPDLSDEALSGFLSLRAEQEFPLPPSDLHCAHSVYETPEGRRATLVALPDKRMKALKSLLQSAGLSALSLSPGLHAWTENEPSGGRLGFLMIDRHVNLVIFAGNGVAELRALVPDNSEPGGDVHFDAKTLNRELRITLGRLPVNIRNDLRDAVFSGAASEVTQVQQILSPALEALGIRVHQLRNDAHHTGAAVIVARKQLCNLPVPFEFIPPRVGRLQQLTSQLSTRGPRRAALSAGAAVVILCAVFWTARSMIESHLSQQWKSMAREVEALEEIQAELRLFRPWAETNADSLQILNLVTSTFPDQGDLWVSRLEIKDDRKVSLSGFSKQQEAFSAMRQKLMSLPQVADTTLEQQRGHAPLQYEIQFQWSAQRHD